MIKQSDTLRNSNKINTKKHQKLINLSKNILSHPPSGQNIPCSLFVKIAAKLYPDKSKSFKASSEPTQQADEIM